MTTTTPPNRVPVPEPHPVGDTLRTLESHILAEERRHPGASGALSWILSALTLSAKIIANKIRRARIDDVLGTLGTQNFSGEPQQKLDVIANETLMRALGEQAPDRPRRSSLAACLYTL